MCCGLGDDANLAGVIPPYVLYTPPPPAVSTAVTTVANPVAPAVLANPVTSATGSTFWDFVNQSASYTPQSFFQKYETPLLLGGVVLAGALLFFGMRK